MGDRIVSSWLVCVPEHGHWQPSITEGRVWDWLDSDTVPETGFCDKEQDSGLGGLCTVQLSTDKDVDGV